MFIPNGFENSVAVHAMLYDEEGRLKQFRVNDSHDSSSSDGGIAEANSLYATDAELFGTITPFLKNNRIRDAQRRNYVVQPGGACIYFEDEKQMEDPYAHGRVQFTAPSEQESFGHNSMDGTKFGADNRGRAFTIGHQPGKQSTGPGR